MAIDGATMRWWIARVLAGLSADGEACARWGAGFQHGDPLFGLANQLLWWIWLRAVRNTIGVGYRLWWIRRPPQAAWDPAASPLLQGVAVARLACPKPGAWAGVCP